MKAFNYLLIGVLACGATAVHGAELGQCGARRAMTAALADEGQHVILKARQAQGALRITANADRSVGYLLTGTARLCVGARLTALRIERPRAAGSMAAAQARHLCAGAVHDGASACGTVLKQAARVSELNVAIVVQAGASQALSAARGTRFVAVQPSENWDSAMLGFCRRKDRGLQLCMSSHTAAP
jgi:hypothetical protein